MLTAAGYSRDLAEGLRDTAVVTVSVTITAVLVGSIADRGFEYLWRGLPGGRSFIGPPANPTATRLAIVAAVTVLITFPAGVSIASGEQDGLLDVAALALLVVAALAALAWNTRPIFELRRRISRRTYAGDVNLAQLRHAATADDRRSLLESAVADLTEKLDGAEAVITRERRRSPDIGEATVWRDFSGVAHGAARDSVDVFDSLVALDDDAEALELLRRGSDHCARAAARFVDTADLDDAAAHAVLDPHLRRGARRDRRIARKALRGRASPR